MDRMALANALDPRVVQQMIAMRGMGQGQSLGGPRGQMQGYGPPPPPPQQGPPPQGPFSMPGR